MGMLPPAEDLSAAPGSPVSSFRILRVEAAGARLAATQRTPKAVNLPRLSKLQPQPVTLMKQGCAGSGMIRNCPAQHPELPLLGNGASLWTRTRPPPHVLPLLPGLWCCR